MLLSTKNDLMGKKNIVLWGNYNDFPKALKETLKKFKDIFKNLLDIKENDKIGKSGIKNNLLKKHSKIKDEMNKINTRLSNKSFTDKAPKDIVDLEKTNFDKAHFAGHSLGGMIAPAYAKNILKKFYL